MTIKKIFFKRPIYKMTRKFTRRDFNPVMLQQAQQALNQIVYAGKKIMNNAKKATGSKVAPKTVYKGAGSTTTTQRKKKTAMKTVVKGPSRNAGNFKPKKKTQSLDWNIKGSVETFEFNGEAQSVECAYLGHSALPPRRVLISICRCIIKELFRQHGRSIENWNEPLDETTVAGYAKELTYSYFTNDTVNNLSPDEDPTTTIRIISLTPASITFNQMAQNLATDIHDNLTNARQHIFTQFALRYVETGIAIRRVFAEIKPSHFNVSLGNTSLMKVQNITGARDAEADPTDNNDTDNIAKNPVVYKSYDAIYKNGFSYVHKKNQSVGSTTGFSFCGDDSTGLIQYDPITHLATSLYKPPAPYSFGIKSKTSKSASGVLQPGDIKSSYIKFTTKLMPLNMLLNKFMDTFGNTYDYLINLGTARMFAFEHQLNMTSLGIDDPAVKLQYQVDTTLRSRYTYTPKVYSERIITIL